jgi:hypothetical protein
LAGGNRLSPPPLGDRQQEARRPNLATALPPSVLRDHLMPWLSLLEAARLRVVCKALNGMVREWPMHLGDLGRDAIEAALTCFPAAESLVLWFPWPLAQAEEARMVEVLREHGRTIKRVIGGVGGGIQLFSAALHAGALPKLTHTILLLKNPIHREVLSHGTLGLLEKVNIVLEDGELAPLQHLRCLPYLRGLELRGEEPPLQSDFPPFIPPSLRTLTINILPLATLEALLRDLPSMLQASGARLEAIELWSATEELSAAGGVAIAHLLRLSSPTLRRLNLRDINLRILGLSCLSEVVPGLVSCCDTLEVLRCPAALFNALPAPCPGFPRLTELELDSAEYVVDMTSPGWGLLAGGGLPALASLAFAVVHGSLDAGGDGCSDHSDCVSIEGRESGCFDHDSVGEEDDCSDRDSVEGGGHACMEHDCAGDGDDVSCEQGPLEGEEEEEEEEEEGLLASALEGVARTLRRLTVEGLWWPDAPEGDGASYELGAAIGRLRRLQYLSIDLSSTGGRAYQAVGRGLADSGGCPELFELRVGGLSKEIDCLTYEPSLIVPSVRYLHIRAACSDNEALLLGCSLVQVGYKYGLAGLKGTDNRPLSAQLSACLRAMLQSR